MRTIALSASVAWLDTLVTCPDKDSILAELANFLNHKNTLSKDKSFQYYA
jgi:hypothetical protein